MSYIDRTLLTIIDEKDNSQKYSQSETKSSETNSSQSKANSLKTHASKSHSKKPNGDAAYIASSVEDITQKNYSDFRNILKSILIIMTYLFQYWIKIAS